MFGVVGDLLKREFRFVVVRNQEVVAGRRNFKNSKWKATEEQPGGKEGSRGGDRRFRSPFISVEHRGGEGRAFPQALPRSRIEAAPHVAQ